jgi:hypothetical protein
MTTKITSGLFAQGSFDLRKINRNNGLDIGQTIRVWFVHRNGECVGKYLTRKEALRAIKRSVTAA